MTNAGIEHNLKNSPYVYTSYYNDKCVMLYFSGESSYSRFISSRDAHYENLTYSLFARFKINFKISRLFSDVDLYRRVERRGFLINIEGKFCECLTNLILDCQPVNVTISEMS